MTENEAIEELKQNIEMPFGSDISDGASRLAIEALEEIQQYRSIGTVEECREATERQRVKKPVFVHPLQSNDGGDYMCPTCKTGTVFNAYDEKSEFCPYCGQNLDWSDVDGT